MEEFGAFGNFEEQTSEQPPVEENQSDGGFGDFGNFEEEETGPVTDDQNDGFGNFDEEPTP